jgi:glycosyltransferase involved in cell wall biosynthesis
MNHMNETKQLSTISLSLLLLTKNESSRLPSLASWIKKCPAINEIICVDDHSSDGTPDQIRKLKSPCLTIKTFSRNLNNDFAAQRNFALSRCQNDWILWLDADETPSPELIEFLNSFQPQQNFNYAFRRLDDFLGQTLYHGETGNGYFIRLFNKTSGAFKGRVHETWHSPNPVRNLNLVIHHPSHQSLSSFLNKINFYSTIRAQELYQQRASSSLISIIFYPTAKFIQNYFFKLGFLDSTAGIINALGMSLHSFLVRAKLWQALQGSSLSSS